MKYGILFIVIFISGCVTEPIDYTQQYDPNEKVLNGVVVTKSETNKEIVKKRLDDLEKSKNYDLIFSTILSVGTGFVMVPTNIDDGVGGEPIEYGVKLKTGKTLKIFNYYSGFEKSECVKVFLSQNWRKYPPRMASGGEC